MTCKHEWEIRAVWPNEHHQCMECATIRKRAIQEDFVVFTYTYPNKDSIPTTRRVKHRRRRKNLLGGGYQA